jgi:hypothetical protein
MDIHFSTKDKEAQLHALHTAYMYLCTYILYDYFSKNKKIKFLAIIRKKNKIEEKSISSFDYK